MSEPDDERLQQAKALVSALNSLEWKVKSLTEELARTKAREDSWRKSYWMVNDERGEWFKRRWAVDNLHSESQRPTCGDGCCSEGVGTCSYCKEPYPCRTIQALDKEPEDWPPPPADDDPPADRPLVKELTK